MVARVSLHIDAISLAQTRFTFFKLMDFISPKCTFGETQHGTPDRLCPYVWYISSRH